MFIVCVYIVFIMCAGEFEEFVLLSSLLSILLKDFVVMVRIIKSHPSSHPPIMMGQIELYVMRLPSKII